MVITFKRFDRFEKCFQLYVRGMFCHLPHQTELQFD